MRGAWAIVGSVGIGGCTCTSLVYTFVFLGCPVVLLSWYVPAFPTICPKDLERMRGAGETVGNVGCPVVLVRPWCTHSYSLDVLLS